MLSFLPQSRPQPELCDFAIYGQKGRSVSRQELLCQSRVLPLCWQPGLWRFVYCFHKRIMAVYTQDEMTKSARGPIHTHFSSFLSANGCQLNCDHHAAVHGKAALPLYASMFALLFKYRIELSADFWQMEFSPNGRGGCCACKYSRADHIMCCHRFVFIAVRKKRVRCHLWPGTAQKIRNNIKNSILQSSARCLSANFCGVWGKCLYSNLWKYRNRCMRGDDHDHSCPDHCNRGAGGLAQASGILIGKSLGAKRKRRRIQRRKTDVVRTGGIGAAVCVPCSCQPVLCKDL